jgi:hypothetical protein
MEQAVFEYPVSPAINYSEYMRISNNKAIEIFNGTGNAVDF